MQVFSVEEARGLETFRELDVFVAEFSCFLISVREVDLFRENQESFGFDGDP